MDYQDEILENIFDDSYESTYNNLVLRTKNQNFDFEQVKNELAGLYKYDGLAWTGRSDIKQREIDGQLLAYQIFIKRYVKMQEEKEGCFRGQSLN